MLYETWKSDLLERKINVSENFIVQGLLTSDQEISQWNINRLPDDELSTQNGILTENFNRWPLAIDPENQAKVWLKRKCGANLKVLTFTADYIKYVGLRVHNGGTVLIENILDTIDRIKLIDTNFIESTLPPGGGTNTIDPRFISLFSLFNISIDNGAASKIYDIILTNYLSGYDEGLELTSFKDKLIAATVQLYSAVKAELSVHL